MKSPKIEHSVHPMTVEAATDYAQRVHSKLMDGVSSDDEADWAYAQFERQFGVGRRTIEHLRKKRAKGCDVSVFGKIKSAYLALCEAQLRKLQHEIAIEKATHDDDDLADLEVAAAAIAARLEARKAARAAPVAMAVSEEESA